MWRKSSKATFRIQRLKKSVNNLKMKLKSKEEDQQSTYWQGGEDPM
jgi:hypothetical protein